MHYTDKTHFFRDAEDNRATAITTMVAPGKFDAFLIEGLDLDPVYLAQFTGHGDTRLAAIANLVDVLKALRAEDRDDDR